MKFSTKPSLSLGSTMYTSLKWSKPVVCPHCGFGTDGNITGCGSVKLNESDAFFVISILCTYCNKNYVAAYRQQTGNVPMEYLECYPHPSGPPLRECLGKISGRFVELHKQAEFAELNSMYDIAAMGYRAALEILIKDYSIKELNQPADAVENKQLAAAISEYLYQESLVKTADVVRILGNDYAHYKRGFPQHDFTVLKRYYDIFLALVATQYDITHPPVEKK